MKTLADIYNQHPEWRNIPVVVSNGDGYDWLDGSAAVFVVEDDVHGKVLCFCPN